MRPISEWNVRKVLTDLIRVLLRRLPQAEQPEPKPEPIPEPPAPKPVPTPDPPVSRGREGLVTVSRRAFVDSGGLFNPLGASLFWALWGERNDPDRLDANLAYLAAHDFDYVRILGMVGAVSWEDRTINPTAPDYWRIVDSLFERLARHGLRAQVTVFADAQVMMPDHADRRRFASHWADMSAGDPTVLFLEGANEAWQNGFGHSSGAAELRELCEIMRRQTTAPVAVSAPPDGEVGRWLGGWPGIATMHYDRDTSKADGAWRPVRQPWGWPDEYRHVEGFDGPLPAACVNNEPIGPGSSVASDDDPTRIALAYATTFVAGGSAYCYHTGAGIRGGGAFDLARGRKSNLFDEPAEVAAALSATRRLLPGGLANWERANAQWATMPWDGSQHAVDRRDIIRAYAAMQGNEIVGVILGVARPHLIAARTAITLALHNPATGDLVAAFALDVGQTATIPSTCSGYIVRGHFR